MQKFKGMYSAQEIKQHIDPYLELVQRNQDDIRARCLELADMHLEHLPTEGKDLSMMSDEEKIDALYVLYDRGTNKDNAERTQYHNLLDEQMKGRVMNEIQSYNYLGNDKY